MEDIFAGLRPYQWGEDQIVVKTEWAEDNSSCESFSPNTQDWGYEQEQSQNLYRGRMAVAHNIWSTFDFRSCYVDFSRFVKLGSDIFLWWNKGKHATSKWVRRIPS